MTIVEKTASHTGPNGGPEADIKTAPTDETVLMVADGLPSMDKYQITPLSMAPLDSRRSLLLKWIPVLYKGGATPFFVQRHVESLCKILDLSANTTFIPGRVMLTWNESSTLKSEHTNSLYQPAAITLRVSWGFRVEMLQKMNNLLSKLEKQVDSPQYTIEELHMIVDKAQASLPVYNNWVVLAAFGVLSGSMAPAFFQGNYFDGLCALILGTMAGAFAIGSDYFPASFLFMHEIVCSFLSSLFTVLACAAFPSAGLNYWPIVLATTIWILPGFSMVIGFMDVVTKFTTTGFITHAAGTFIGLTMALGFSISIRFLEYSGLSIPELRGPGVALKNYERYPLCMVFAIACTIIFQGSPKQMPLVAAAVMVCFAILDSLSSAPETAVCGLVAFALGVVVRILARMTNQLPEAGIYVSMLPLVPGSKIVRSTFKLLTHVHRLNDNPITKSAYESQDSNGWYPQWIESTFVCVAVALGFIGAEVFFSKVLMQYIVTPFLGPYFLFPLKRNFVVPYICEPSKRLEAKIKSIFSRREEPPITAYDVKQNVVPQTLT